MADYPALSIWTDAYLADTRHLGAMEHGAYLLLIMEAWRRPTCSLPDDDKLLARLACCTPDEWAAIKDGVLAFWQYDGRKKTWTQKRLLKERARTAKFRASQADKSRTRWNKEKKAGPPAKPNASRTVSPEDATLTLTLTHKEREGNSVGDYNHYRAREDVASTNDADAQTPMEAAVQAMGADPKSGITGPTGHSLYTQANGEEFKRWQTDLGLSLQDMLAVIAESMRKKREPGPPQTFKYFRAQMERRAAEIDAPPLTPKTENRINGTQNGPSAIEDYIARVAAGEVTVPTPKITPW